jgi:hypothetical protein
MAVSERVINGVPASEIRSYMAVQYRRDGGRNICSGCAIVEGIENSLHWMLDACFCEGRIGRIQPVCEEGVR